jgi:hypothetical protein
VVSPETHAAVFDNADVLIDGVDGTVALLAGVADRLTTSIR